MYNGNCNADDEADGYKVVEPCCCPGKLPETREAREQRCRLGLPVRFLLPNMYKNVTS